MIPKLKKTKKTKNIIFKNLDQTQISKKDHDSKTQKN